MRRFAYLDLLLAAAAGLMAWHAGPLATGGVAAVVVAAAVLLTRKAP